MTISKMLGHRSEHLVAFKGNLLSEIINAHKYCMDQIISYLKCL